MSRQSQQTMKRLRRTGQTEFNCNAAASSEPALMKEKFEKVVY